MTRKCEKHGCDMLVKKFFPPSKKFKHGSVTVYCPECELEKKEWAIKDSAEGWKRLFKEK